MDGFANMNEEQHSVNGQAPVKVQSPMTNGNGKDTGLNSPQHPDTGLASPQHPDTGLASPQHPDTGLASPQHPDTGLASPQHPDTGLASPQHPDTGLFSPQHPDTGLASPQHPDTCLASPQHPDTGLASSQHTDQMPNLSLMLDTSADVSSAIAESLIDSPTKVMPDELDRKLSASLSPQHPASASVPVDQPPMMGVNSPGQPPMMGVNNPGQPPMMGVNSPVSQEPLFDGQQSMVDTGMPDLMGGAQQLMDKVTGQEHSTFTDLKESAADMLDDWMHPDQSNAPPASAQAPLSPNQVQVGALPSPSPSAPATEQSTGLPSLDSIKAAATDLYEDLPSAEAMKTAAVDVYDDLPSTESIKTAANDMFDDFLKSDEQSGPVSPAKSGKSVTIAGDHHPEKDDRHSPFDSGKDTFSGLVGAEGEGTQGGLPSLDSIKDQAQDMFDNLMPSTDDDAFKHGHSDNPNNPFANMKESVTDAFDNWMNPDQPKDGTPPMAGDLPTAPNGHDHKMSAPGADMFGDVALDKTHSMSPPVSPNAQAPVMPQSPNKEPTAQSPLASVGSAAADVFNDLKEGQIPDMLSGFVQQFTGGQEAVPGQKEDETAAEYEKAHLGHDHTDIESPCVRRVNIPEGDKTKDNHLLAMSDTEPVQQEDNEKEIGESVVSDAPVDEPVKASTPNNEQPSLTTDHVVGSPLTETAPVPVEAEVAPEIAPASVEPTPAAVTPSGDFELPVSLSDVSGVVAPATDELNALLGTPAPAADKKQPAKPSDKKTAPAKTGVASPKKPAATSTPAKKPAVGAAAKAPAARSTAASATKKPAATTGTSKPATTRPATAAARPAAATTRPAAPKPAPATRTTPATARTTASTRMATATSRTPSSPSTRPAPGARPSPSAPARTPVTTPRTPTTRPAVTSARATAATNRLSAPRTPARAAVSTTPSTQSPRTPSASRTSTAKSKIGSTANIQHKPAGGDKKIDSNKVKYEAKSKIGSLENATHKPGGGTKKIESQKVDFKNKAQPKVGSLENATHKAKGGDVQIYSEKVDFSAKAAPKIGSLVNADHTPGGGDIKIQSDKVDFSKNAKPRIDAKLSTETAPQENNEGASAQQADE